MGAASDVTSRLRLGGTYFMASCRSSWFPWFVKDGYSDVKSLFVVWGKRKKAWRGQLVAARLSWLPY